MDFHGKLMESSFKFYLFYYAAKRTDMGENSESSGDVSSQKAVIKGVTHYELI
ncbi:hypothetical protein GCM10009001_09020 [Virgibacillus siamensis]|uniref:Uncharacterized protein n=1 Tax=Virgibacillus siamensis TaxID=480071 RepID=A0ABN1FPG3_9BACI